MPSTDPSTPSSPTIPVDTQQAANAAAASRGVEVSLKSRPLPEGFDPNRRATVGEAIQTIAPQDFLKVHQAPCSREGFLTGIGSGAAVGFIRYIIGAPVPKAANWAVGSGVLVSIAAYEWCQHGRRMERANMKRVVEVYTQKQAELKKQEDEKKALGLPQQGSAQKAQKSWYKFW